MSAPEELPLEKSAQGVPKNTRDEKCRRFINLFRPWNVAGRTATTINHVGPCLSFMLVAATDASDRVACVMATFQELTATGSQSRAHPVQVLRWLTGPACAAKTQYPRQGRKSTK
jgi:hypothetical protein